MAFDLVTKEPHDSQLGAPEPQLIELTLPGDGIGALVADAEQAPLMRRRAGRMLDLRTCRSTLV
jgi:hypothetical protein